MRAAWAPFPPRITDVGVVVDLATHDLNIMEHLVGAPPVRLFAETSRRLHAAHEDMVSATLRFENGTVGVLDINWLTPTKVRELWVHGEGGLFRVDYISQDLFHFENSSVAERADMMQIMGVSEGRMIRYPVAKQEPLRAELISFRDAILHGAPVRVDGREGLRALELAQHLLDAGESHRAVNLGSAASSESQDSPRNRRHP
jgi:UDP-N-acetylglucosamine 3-dehydrogenase